MFIVLCCDAGVVASTAMNVESSRSHAIFSITVETSVMRADNQQHVKMGVLRLVDLAVRVSCTESMILVVNMGNIPWHNFI